MKQSLGTKTLALCLALLIFMGNITFPSTAQAGIITNLVTKNLGAVAFELLERSVIYGLGEASNATEQEEISKLLAAAKRFCTGAMAPTLGKITEICSKTLKKVTEIQASLEANFLHVDKQLADIQESILKQNFNAKRHEVRSFYEKYNLIYNEYSELLSLMQTYSEDPTDENKNKLDQKYRVIESFYTKTAGGNPHEGAIFNLDQDLYDFLTVISPYSYGQAIRENTQPSDASAWGSPVEAFDTTFLGTYRALIHSVYPFEHQAYDEMVLAINQVAGTLNTYLTALRLYTEFGVQSINTDPTLTEEERKTQIEEAWSKFDTRSYRALRGMEQMLSLYQK